MNTVYINSGTFHAEIDSEGLPSLPVRNVRKLFKLLTSDPSSDNSEAIQTITDWLPGAVSDAKNTWGYTVALYKDGWRAVKKGSRKDKDVEQRERNHALADSVKFAKADYDAVAKLQSIFHEFF